MLCVEHLAGRDSEVEEGEIEINAKVHRISRKVQEPLETLKLSSKQESRSTQTHAKKY